MLRADVVVAEGERLAQRELEHLLRARRERNLTRGDLVPLADDAGDLRAHLFHGDVERLEHPCGETFLFTQEAEEDVLRADVVVLQRACLVLCQDHDLSRPFGESLEHCSLDPPFVPRSAAGLRRVSKEISWYPTRVPTPPGARSRCGGLVAGADAGCGEAVG